MILIAFSTKSRTDSNYTISPGFFLRQRTAVTASVTFVRRMIKHPQNL